MDLTEYIAHSADIERNIGPQSYSQHIRNVKIRANQFSTACVVDTAMENTPFVNTVCRAIELHDLGKLHPDVQSALHNGRKPTRPHSPAGTMVSRDDYS